MNIVIIGGSGHFHYALNGLCLRRDITLSAFAPGKAGEDMSGFKSQLAERGFAPTEFEDYRVMLEKICPEIAVINSWFCDNADIAMYCFARGIDVYCEKPLATEIAKLDELERAYEQSGRALGCMLDGRHTPWLRTVKRAVDAGDIGEIRLIHAQKSYRMGTRGGVYQKRAFYGGMLPWVGIHAVDWIEYITGERATWVAAMQSAGCNRGNGELETAAAAILRLPNGVMATLSADYLRPLGSARHDDDRIRVTGTRGTIEVIDGVAYLENEMPRRALVLEDERNPFLYFVDAVIAGDAEKQARDAFYATRTCLIARRSADLGASTEII